MINFCQGILGLKFYYTFKISNKKQNLIQVYHPLHQRLHKDKTFFKPKIKDLYFTSFTIFPNHSQCKDIFLILIFNILTGTDDLLN